MPENEKDVGARGARAPEPQPDAFGGSHRALLDGVSDMVTVSDRDGRIVYANAATERVSGYTPAEFASLDPFERMHPEDRPRCEEAFERLLGTPGLSVELEHRVRHKDGSWRWVEGTFRSLFEDPEVGGLVATVRDITERMRIEEALRRSEEDLRLVTDSVPVLIGYHDTEQRYRFVNAAYEDFFGVTREEILGRTAREFLGERVHERLREGMERALSGERVSFEDEEPDKHGPGLHGWTQENYLPRLAEDGTTVEGFFALAVDITERKRAEEALRESEEKYRTLFETVDEGFALCELVRDPRGKAVDYRVLEINPAYERHTGTTAARVVGRLRSEFDPVRNERTLKLCASVVDTGEPVRFEYFNEGLDRWFTIGLFAHVGDRFAALFEDITERKRREANRELLVDISEDLGHLSDEEEILRNVGAKLAAHLKLTCYHYVDVDEERAEVTIRHFWHALDVPYILGTYPIDGFMPPNGLDILRSGESAVINDVQNDFPDDGAATAALKAGAAAQKIGAYVVVPYSQDGRWKAYFAAADSRPRRWSSPEIELIQEVSSRLFPRIERARAEEALRESEERYRTLVDNVGDHAIFMLGADGRVTEWTESARRLKGYSAEEIIGRHVSVFYAPEEIASGDPERELAEAAREGRAEREGWRVRKDGEKIWVDEIATAVRNAGGDLVGFAKISRDLTERRSAERALREGEERLRIAAEAAWLGRWELVPKTGTLTGDEVFGAQHGSPPGVHPDFEGHLEAIHPEDREEVRRRVAAAIGGRQGYEAEYRVPLPDGSTRWVLSHGRFIPGVDPDPDRLVGVTLDASGHHELERERELARARELTALAEAAERERISRELHDRVAHHMGVAHQSLELYSALKEAAPERAAERLKLARETTRLALDQTRSLSAELKRLQDEELAEGLEDAFVKLSESYVPEGVEMEVSLSGEESRVPKPTRTQAYLAMREAIRNAVRHSGCSRIEVNLRVEEGELFGLVEDDGEGFDPEAVRKATPSWGVGLRSMRERVEMLGGTLRVDSGPGAGTRAELRVPLDGWRP